MPYKDADKQAEARKRYEEKRKKQNGERHKVWTGIFYPDSAPPEDEWREAMSQMHVKIWVGPPHDKDAWTKADERKNPAHRAGTLKKKHLHYIAEYEVQVDLQTFLDDFAFLNGGHNVKYVRSLRSMVRYLCHLDDPDKAQYDRADVLTFGGADFDIVEQLGSHERHEALRAMRVFIRDNGIVNFCDFVDYCDECESAWSALLDDNSSYVIEKYIKSRRYKMQDAQRETERAAWLAGQARPVGPGVEISGGPGGAVGNTTPDA